ncbi:MAG: hypothetical protein HY909_23120 [Deltaproteobacteria bacterium]|nr:hypothetical protein [Deltaproteobacteria bacterium]
MSPEAREALRVRRGITLDPRKRLDELEQTARALVAETDLRVSRFPAEVRLLLQRLAVSGAALQGGSREPGAATLLDLGIAYAALPPVRRQRAPRATDAPPPPPSLLLPSAFLVQVPVGEGEDPRSLRACLSMTDPEIVGPMVTAVVGRPLGVAGAMALQEVWEALAAPGALEALILALPPAEARLLDALERVGSEVTTEELLGLDQAPGLYRTQSGIAVPKRGAPYALQRKGLLFQLGVERFVVPTEVARIVGGGRQRERTERRESIRAAVLSEDHAPVRARYARDPSLATVAALAMLRAWEVPVPPHAGVARASLRRVAERLGETEESVALWVALARAAGLARLVAPKAPVGSLDHKGTDVGASLWKTYLQGGAWDETRAEPEVLRSGLLVRGGSAAGTARQVLIEALEVVARDTWASVDAVVRFAAEDPRALAAQRVHERSRRERPEVFRGTVQDALRAMLTRSLPALGMVDLAEDLHAVRMVTRASLPSAAAQAALGRHLLEVPLGSRLDALLAFADVGEPDHLCPEGSMIAFALGVGALARARARGLSSAEVLERLSGVGARPPYPPAVEELVRGVGAAREAGFMVVGGAIFVEDPELRAELRADAGVRRVLLEVDAGPLLLVRAEVDLARIQARLSRLGVKLLELSPPDAEPATRSSRPVSVNPDDDRSATG